MSSALPRSLSVAVGAARFDHVFVVFLEDIDHATLGFAFGRDLFPKYLSGGFDGCPFLIGNCGEFQFAAVNAQVGLTAPIPPLAIVVLLVTADPEQGLQIFGQFVPALHVSKKPVSYTHLTLPTKA